jgi:phosphoserine aminotransferase
MGVWSFAAGPGAMPAAVLARVREELPDYRGCGQSALELPFTGTEFRELLAQAQADLRALLAVPGDYAVLWCGRSLARGASVSPPQRRRPEVARRAAGAADGYCCCTSDAIWRTSIVLARCSILPA